MSVRRAGKLGLWFVLGALGALTQGFAVFWYFEPYGPFLGRGGLECTVIPLVIEVVVLVLSLKNLDHLHASAISNPHSLLGHSLRNDAARPPPPARSAWDGQWEDPTQAADKMGPER